MKVSISDEHLQALLSLTGETDPANAMRTVIATYRTICDNVVGETVTIIDMRGDQIVIPLTRRAALAHVHESDSDGKD